MTNQGKVLKGLTKQTVDIQFEGQTYLLTPMGPSHLGLLQKWAEEEPFRKMRRQVEILGDVVTPELLQKMYESAEKRSAEVNVLSEGESAVNTVEGIQEMFYILTRDNHPELDREDVKRMITVETLSQFADAVKDAAGIDEDKEENSEARPTKVPRETGLSSIK
jgi:hypothetical protein